MPPVPEQLMARLHEATEHLQQARKRLDGVDMFNTDESRTAATALREAERELEDVTREIDDLLPKDEPGGIPSA